MMNGMTSVFTINHILVKILIIIDNYEPMGVKLNHQLIALLYVHISADIYQLFIGIFTGRSESMSIFAQTTSYDVFTNGVICILTSSIMPSLSILNICRLQGLTALSFSQVCN